MATETSQEIIGGGLSHPARLLRENAFDLANGLVKAVEEAASVGGSKPSTDT
ncbi:hypothetical protein ACWGQ5_00685 [Streptomyces sp. NPDC055722]